MSNHYHIVLSQNVTPTKLREAMDEIFARRFNRYKVSFVPHESAGRIEFEFHWPRGEFYLWQNTARKLEGRHASGHKFYWWMHTVIAHELAAKFGGHIIDEGTGEKMKPVPKAKRYADYTTYVKHWNKGLHGAARGERSGKVDAAIENFLTYYAAMEEKEMPTFLKE